MRPMASVLVKGRNPTEILLIYNIKCGLRIGPPGGKVDSGETPEECGVREVKEELDITVKLEDKLGIYATTSPEGDFLAHTYFATIIEGTPRIMEPKKIGHYDWFDLQAIEDLASRTGRVNPNLISALPDIRDYFKRLRAGLS